MSQKPVIFVVTGTPKALDNVVSVQPDSVSTFYAAVINVSDSACATFDFQMKVPSFWFPIHEIKHWGYAPFLSALRTVNEYYKGEKPILIHCHAGANRSPSVAYAILRAKGYSAQEAEESLKYKDFTTIFQRNIEMGLIPTNIIEFLTEAEHSPDKSVNAILCKLDEQYLSLADKTYWNIKNYTMAGDANTQIKYDRTVRRFFVERKPFVQKREWVEPTFGQTNWHVTPLVQPTQTNG